MAFNINSFITNMKRDGFRPNLFEILITLPGTLNIGSPNNTGAGGVNVSQFTFKAKATAIPGSTIGVAPLSYFGRAAKFAGNRVFDNWTVSVIMDETDFATQGTRGMFENWSALINKHVQNSRSAGLVEPSQVGYFGRGEIIPYSKDGKDLNARYYMEGCFPIDIGPMPLDWGDNDRIAEFNVTFAFQWWNSLGATAVNDATTPGLV